MKKKKEPHLSSPKQIMHSTNTLEHAQDVFFYKGMVNEHVFMNLVSLRKKVQPSLILRFGKVVSSLGINTTCTK